MMVAELAYYNYNILINKNDTDLLRIRIRINSIIILCTSIYYLLPNRSIK